MSVANLKNKFSNQDAAPLKAPGTSFLHGNRVNGAGTTTFQPSVANESKANGRWGTTTTSVSNSVSNGNTERKFENGGKMSTQQPIQHQNLEKRQSSENFGVKLKKVSSGENNTSEQSNNRSFLHNSSPLSPPASNNKAPMFKVADNTKFAKAQQEKEQTSASNNGALSNADSSFRKLNVERTVSEGSPLTNGHHGTLNGATPNKSNLFNSIAKPSTNGLGSLKSNPYSRSYLNKVGSLDETDSVKTHSGSPSSKFGQSTNMNDVTTNGHRKSEVVENKIAASKTIGAALAPRARPSDLKVASPPLAAKPSTQIPRKGSDASSQIARKGSDASPTGLSSDRWRLKCEDSERKRKALIGENQKVQRDLAELDKKFEQLKRDYDNTKKDLSKKDQQLNHLRNLSEGVYKEYDQLKHQHELEISTMRKAMDRASRWYKENKELKRKSSVLIQRVKKEVPHLHQSDDETDSVTEGGSGDDQDSELQDLRSTVSDLTREVSRLQSSLNTAKQREFEAQEAVVEVTASLEEERRARKQAEFSLKELEAKHANLDKVSRLVAAEVGNLSEKFERERKNSQAIRQQADQAKKERNVLAHQSQLLMLEAMADERFMQLLTEIDNLKSQLEDEQNRHDTEIQMLQEKLDERETEPYVEILEEKLKVIENELSISKEKFERAEQRLEELEAGGGSNGSVSAPRPPGPPPPPPPPGNMPPPPPPPPLPSGTGLNVKSVTLKRRESSAVMDMANLLGISNSNVKPTPQGGAIDDIISQLKEGKFTLKATEKKAQQKKEEESPAVVQEMMNVLGTLKKRPKKRESEDRLTAVTA